MTPTVRAIAFGLLAVLAACAGGTEDPNAIDFARPETALTYEADLTGAPSEQIDALMRESLEVFRRQDDGAQSLAFLRRRAQDDVETAQTILRSFGYYLGDAKVVITAPPPQDAAERDAEAPATLVTIAVEPGPQFTLASHDLLLTEAGDRPPPDLDAADFGSPVGAAAMAAEILAAEVAATTALRRDGRPWANVVGRSAVADLEAHTIEVETVIAVGPYAVYGPTRIEGIPGVDPAYIDSYRPWKPGEPVDEEALRAFQQDLVGTNLFDAISVRPPETPPGEEDVEILIAGREAPRRSVSAGLRWSTDVGPSARGRFTHRNLFGANETVNVDLDAGTELQSLDVRYREPQYLRPGQDFTTGFNVRHENNDAFEETAGTVTVGLERRLTDEWTVGAGGLMEISNVNGSSEEDDQTFYLGGLPFFARHDNTDDTLNPTRGVRAWIGLTPFAGYGDQGDTPLFTRIDSRASTYVALDEPRRYILAARGRIGSILTDDPSNVPASKRLYSGGGGSVRGYADRSIGPLDADNDPTGGLSVLELGTEIRARVWGDLGFASFVEAGSVSDQQYPSFEDGMQVAAGVGLRYFSPVGPIRVDFAVPLNPRPSDANFQVYFAIGQAY